MQDKGDRIGQGHDITTLRTVLVVNCVDNSLEDCILDRGIHTDLGSWVSM